MKILIVHQYFNTPQTGGPLRSFYLANGLKANGYEVEIITAHNQDNLELKDIEGIKVHYLPVQYDNRFGFTRRLWAFAKFSWLAYKKAIKLNGVELCYAISTPLSVGWIARRLKAVRGIPYIFEVGDLWPEAPIQMGVLKSSLVIRCLRHFERTIYQGAEKIIALSPGIRDSILQRVPDSKVSVIPNMSDCKYFQMETKNCHLVSDFGVTGKLVVTYFGAAGRANHLEYLIEVAKVAEKVSNVLHFLVMAHGSELSRIKNLANKYGLANIEFLSYRNRSELKKVLNITDAVYVSYADVPILTTGSPNKYFDGLAAGKLMLINFKGWLKTITEQHDLGFYLDPQKPERIAEILAKMVSNPAAIYQSQSNARMIAETFFSRGLAIQKLLKVLEHEDSVYIREAEAYILTA
jgi:glycosyltransferase involved in cell wall biosynthesis